MACEQLEAHGVEIQFGGGEAGARVEELDLAHHAFVALATGDAERRACRFGAGLGRLQRSFAGRETIERSLDLELHLQREFVTTVTGLPFGEFRSAFVGAACTAVEQRPIEQQRYGGEVAAAAELVAFPLGAAVHTERERR